MRLSKLNIALEINNIRTVYFLNQVVRWALFGGNRFAPVFHRLA